MDYIRTWVADIRGVGEFWKKGDAMLLNEELAAMIAAEEKRLGVGSEEFMKRHQDIMEHIDGLMKKGEDERETVYRSERGALDCAWVITKDDRYSMEGTLHITGRDMESQKLRIQFDKKSFQWKYVGTEEDIEAQRLQFEYDQSPVVETIKKLIKQGNGHWEGSASEIQEASKYYG